MTFAIAQYANLSQEQNSWINDLSANLKSCLENRNYGKDLDEFYFGLITVVQEFEQFFKKKRPRYGRGERTSFVNEIDTKSNNCAEISIRFKFSEVFGLNKNQLLEKFCAKLVIESDCLTQLSKYKKFNFKLFKLGLEHYITA